jgi:hypothetical protein
MDFWHVIGPRHAEQSPENEISIGLEQSPDTGMKSEFYTP